MTEDQIKHMVNRFLGWRLPNPWHPDGGVSYQRPNYAHAPADHDWPVGTNLFDAEQVHAMVRHMIEGMPSSESDDTIIVRSDGTTADGRQPLTKGADLGGHY